MRGTAAEARTADQVSLDEGLARKLAAADAQVNADLLAAKAAGAGSLGGLGGAANRPPAVPVGASPQPFGRHLGALAAPVGAFPPMELEDFPPDPPALPTVTPKSGAPMKKLPPGVELQAQLLANAAAYSKRVADAAPSDPAAKHRRLLANLASALRGPQAGGSSSRMGDLDDLDGADADSAADPFGAGSALGAGTPMPSTALLSQQRPGDLMSAALSTIKQKLSAIHGEESVATQRQRVLSFYHEIFFRPQVSGVLKESIDREMVTLATIADSLQEGNLGRAGDIVYGRYKFLEEGVTTGNWDLAAELEAMPARESTLTTEAERHRIASRQLRSVRLRTAVENLRQRGAGG